MTDVMEPAGATPMMDPVSRFLTGIEAAEIPVDVFCDNVVLDATVPNWRFRVRGADAVRAELANWYADAGRFEELKRVGTGDGELVELTLSWREAGVPHACHQAHVIHLRDGQIAAITVFCGGRWSEPLLEEMAQSQLRRLSAIAFGANTQVWRADGGPGKLAHGCGHSPSPTQRIRTGRTPHPRTSDSSRGRGHKMTNVERAGTP